MKNFVGIDLGTTNSAICSYNGSETRIWKSPEQNDVTPSVIYIDQRGNKYVGKRAYDSAPHSPDNAATLFKRLMGTSTPIEFPAVDLTKTPEECSAEVLKTLFDYLPEEIRKDSETGTVITVPAAFDQMKKDATMQAARLAGIGEVALLQEPVAAVMSVMSAREGDGIFLIYDLGGGTLDIAIAESMNSRVTLHSHGGIAMCGGRDFDRALMDNIVRPWLFENFDLPEDFSGNPDFKALIRLATWATERAKIELSARDEAVINLSENEARVKDSSGKDIYLDIPLQREIYDELIGDRVNESIDCARETLKKQGIPVDDVGDVVFVGGPTNYKPLRDKVASELGIPASSANIDVNPMTAVAEGASLFAESIDWSSKRRSRKGARGQLSSDSKLALSFNYIARTPDVKAKIAVQLEDEVAPGSEFQIDSIDTGWTSGRFPLKHGTTIDVALTKSGDNAFKIFVFDAVNGPVKLEQDKITITRTAATVDAIPASHSISVEALEKIGGDTALGYLIKAGDPLPKKGKKIFKAAESLKAGSTGSLNFKLWEGEIANPITDNRFIGVFKISGTDFDDGVISAGDDLECDYEMWDSGNISVEVSVPSIGGTFSSGKNFYSRQEGQIDYSAETSRVIDEGTTTLKRADEISQVVEDPKLDQAREKLESAVSLDPEEKETEKSQEAMEDILEARRLLAHVSKEHLKETRQIDLDQELEVFNTLVREHARPSETRTYDNLAKTAQRSIDKNYSDFEHHLEELRAKTFGIIWRQDWFVVERFNWISESPHLFSDPSRYAELIETGKQFMRSDDIGKLRAVVVELSKMQIGGGPDDNMFDPANIIRA